MTIAKDKSKSIENLIDESRAQQILINRRNIFPIIEAIIVLGRQEMALRGHRDSGNITFTDDFTGPNEGNFRAILKYRALGDENLRKHLESAGQRNKYTSPSVQNEIVAACYEVLTQKVVSQIKLAKVYSVLTDETQDLAAIEQVTNCIRYVTKNEDNQHCVREDFIKFTPTSSTTGNRVGPYAQFFSTRAKTKDRILKNKP